MTEALHVEEQGNYRLSIFQDYDAENPRQDDCMVGVLFMPGTRSIDSDGNADREYSDALERLGAYGFQRWLRIYHGTSTVLPVSMLDHSGLTVWVGAGPHWSDSAGWDSGQVGFIFDTGATRELTGVEPESVEACLRGEIETLNQLLRGDVYGYMVEQLSTCDHGDEHADHVDSCWGFFGMDSVLEEGRAMLEAHAIAV